MKMPRVWEILRGFKDSSRKHGWSVSENEDWVEADNSYHNFLLAREVPLSSFKRIASNGKCVVQEDLNYRVVKAKYTAWLFSERPPETLVKTVLDNPDFSNKIAIYDLSPILEGKTRCARLNSTDSPVFREFESFLSNELKIKLRSFPEVAASESDADGRVVEELA